MSESTQNKKNGTPRYRSKNGRDVPYFAISIVIHAIVIGAVLWIAPVREIFFEREKPEEPQIITSGDELEEIIDEVRDITVERLKGRVMLLDMGQERMANNFRILNEYHQPYAEQQRATAYIRFSEYADDALTRQEMLMNVLKKAKETKKYDPAMEASFANVSQIFTAQEEIRRGIQLLGIEDEDLLQKQHDAEESQITSENAQRWFAQAVNSVRKMENELEETKKAIPEHRKIIEDLKKQIEERDNKIQKLKVEIKNVQNKSREVQRKKEENWRDKQAKLKKKREDMEKQMRELNTGPLKRDRRDEEKRLERALEKQKQLEEKIPERRPDIKDHLELAINTQTNVYFKQKEIVESVKDILKQNNLLTTKTLGVNNQ